MHVRVYETDRKDGVFVQRYDDGGSNLSDRFSWQEACELVNQLRPMVSEYEAQQDALKREYGFLR